MRSARRVGRGGAGGASDESDSSFHVDWIADSAGEEIEWQVQMQGGGGGGAEIADGILVLKGAVDFEVVITARQGGRVEPLERLLVARVNVVEVEPLRQAGVSAEVPTQTNPRLFWQS